MKLSILFLVVLFGISTQCLIAQKKGTPIELENKKFKKLIDRSIDFTIPLLSVEELHKTQEEYIILDAREKKEYEVSHIPGAIYVGYDSPDLEMIKALDKDKKLLFYCSIGYRSEKIGEQAKALGFEEVYNLYGSLFEWANKGYELEDVEQKPTKQIHGYNRIWGRWIENDNFEKVYK